MGAKRIKRNGYVMAKVSDDKGWEHNWEFEHRRVMERHLGRKLGPDEVVHHKDGNRQNNTLDNLELTTRKDHQIRHHPELFENQPKDELGRFAKRQCQPAIRRVFSYAR